MKAYLTYSNTISTGNVELLEDIVYPQKVHVLPSIFDNLKSGLFYVPHKIVNMLLEKEVIEKVKNSSVEKTAFILASGNSSFAGLSHRKYADNKLNYQYKFLPLTLTQVYAGRIAQSFGVNDFISTDASACASSLKVMMDVLVMIRHYGFNRVIVLTVEDGVSNSVLEFFGESKASITKKDEDNGIKPSAFDSVNKGFRLGQGAAIAIFESEKVLNKWVDTPQAELVGAYTASECSTNAMGQNQNGEGFIKAINGAIEDSKESVEKINIVKTHGTGTESNNVSEKNALTATLKDFVATSYKQKIGHTMGSSGLLETLLLLKDLRDGFIPEIENRTDDDNVFLSKRIDSFQSNVLSIAAGMGNIYSAAIFNPVRK
jgi:3-oxoacyl-[acyl-carrier-protein] synthase-1